jgi:hypothetical protein
MKQYLVTIRNEEYLIDAPNKRTAKWVAYNLYQYNYFSCTTIKDITKCVKCKAKGEKK